MLLIRCRPIGIKPEGHAPVDPRKRFGTTLREMRTARGLSQERLAEACGLHRTYVGGIERGERNVSLLNICRIAAAIEVLPAQLLQDIAASDLPR